MERIKVTESQTNFGTVIPKLSEKYHLICVNYDGFDGSDLIFPDIITVTEKFMQCFSNFVLSQ